MKIARVKEDLNELNGFPPPLFEHFGEESDGRNKSTTDSGGSMKVIIITLVVSEKFSLSTDHCLHKMGSENKWNLTGCSYSVEVSNKINQIGCSRNRGSKLKHLKYCN